MTCTPPEGPASSYPYTGGWALTISPGGYKSLVHHIAKAGGHPSENSGGGAVPTVLPCGLKAILTVGHPWPQPSDCSPV